MKKLKLLITTLFCLGLLTASAQYTILVNFNGTSYPQGSVPPGGITLGGTKIYGTSSTGGLGAGCIYSVKTDGTGYTDLYNFGVANVGSEPGCTLVLNGTKLYGITDIGPLGYGCHFGDIFSINTDGSGYTELHKFGDTPLPTGSEGEGSLTLSNNVLYGMTLSGGAFSDGVIFSYNLNTNTYTDLFDFNGTDGSPGGFQDANNCITVSGNMLYGMTGGGGANNIGCVFSFNTTTSTYTKLLDFNGTNGDQPYGSLTISGNVLYGMTYSGGSHGGGLVFSIHTDGSNYNDILDFNGANGALPYGSLAISGNVLYGMTKQGGTPGDGNIFSVQTNGSNYHDLYDFDNIPNGSYPLGDLTLSGGYLYGLVGSGVNGNGILFKFYDACNLSVRETAATNESCNGESNGSAVVTVTGAAGPCTYSWSPGVGTNSTTTGLSAGIYTVTVTDTTGYNSTVSVTITQPASPVGITISSVTNGACTTGGSITANAASGGTPFPIISTIAGDDIAGYSGNGGYATSAELYNPKGIAVDGFGNIFIVDYANSVIREVNHSTGIINTVAGNNTAGYSGDGGLATSAQLSYPVGIALDGADNIYIADYANSVIREVNHSTGIISTVAGNGTVGYTGDGGTATTAALANPTGVAVDGSGNIFIADVINNVIREVNYSTGIIYTVAGNGTAGYSGDGGSALSAQLNNPNGLAVDGSDNIFIADVGNNVIREVNFSTGNISTVAGNNIAGYSGNGGPATASELSGAYGVAIDGSGNIFIADEGNEVIREVNHSTDIINTVAGNNTLGYTGNNGIATSAELGFPEHVAVDGLGNIYISEVYNDVIQEVSSVNSTIYNYSWTPSGGTNLTATGLSAGTYTITATDANGCTTSTSTNVTQSSGISISISSVTGVNCSTGVMGSVTASGATEGIAPYTYSWLPSGGTNLSATNLSGGTYTILATDNNGCTGTVSTTITQVASTLAIYITSVSNVLCNGGTGSITAHAATGGTAPYTYEWSDASSQSTVRATDLSAGTYIIMVTDKHGCTATSSAAITQPALPLTVELLSMNGPLCKGESNGSATAGVTGGTLPYTYSWSRGGSSGLTATGLSAGAYTFTVKDSNKCSVIVSVTITQPLALGITLLSVTNALCNGDTGNITANMASGGTLPYSYSWSDANSQTSLTATGLLAGTYTMTVMDVNGCSATASTKITQPTALEITITNVSNVLCNGGTGSITAHAAAGGTVPYTYLWSDANSQTTVKATGLSVGTYTIMVIDKHGCTTTDGATITQPSTLVCSLNVTNPLCYKGGGSATITTSGGTLPYSYTWSPNVSITSSATGLTARSYTVTVKDSNKCEVIANFTITQPYEIRDSIVKNSTINILCNGASTGIGWVGVVYGTPPYTYSWSPNVCSSNSASGLSAGTYSITLADINGCSGTIATLTITQPAPLNLSLSTGTCVNNLLKATVTVTGGVIPYTYSWSPGGGTKATMTGLSAGTTYTITVTDKNDCSITYTQLLHCIATDAPVRDTSNGSSDNCCPDNVNLYPNPNSGQFTITGIEKGMIIEVYDYTGRKIRVISASNETMQLNISNENDGLYLIRITDKDGNLVSQKKAVKTQ